MPLQAQRFIPGSNDEALSTDILIYEPNFVVDGKYITSVGGALGYQPALYLIETLYTPWHAEEIGKGLVLDWNPGEVPYLIVSQESANE
ncbi:MAG: hypothetical protein WBW88_17415 [Rhodothermales bacterium]